MSKVGRLVFATLASVVLTLPLSTAQAAPVSTADNWRGSLWTACESTVGHTWYANDGAYGTIPKVTLRRGSTGPCVRYLQDLLNVTSRINLSVDGVFGPATQSAVTNMQRTCRSVHTPPMSVDGIVGKQSWWVLDLRDGEGTPC